MRTEKNWINDTLIIDIILILIGGLILKEKEMYFYTFIVILSSFTLKITKSIVIDLRKNINL